MKIPLSIPSFSGREKEYVNQAMTEGWVSTGGAFIRQFEEYVAAYVGVEQAVACQTGTAGLHIALILAGVKYGDEVLAPDLTFIATINPIKYLGASPILMDVDERLCLDPYKLEQFLEEMTYMREGKCYNKKTGKTIKAMMVVHIFGNMADMVPLISLGKKYGLKIIEDATEAIGTYYLEGPYKGKYAGTIGDFGVYSFNGNKIITTGGGGMLLAKKPEDSRLAKHLTTQAKENALYYQHDQVGYNYRMTNLQGALGLAQIEQLETFIEIKIKNYQIYKKLLEQIVGIELIEFASDIRANRWFYTIMVDQESFGMNRNQLLEYLLKVGIDARPIWGLMHEQLPFLEEQHIYLEKVHTYGTCGLNLPCSIGLTKKEIQYVVRKIEEAG